LTTRVLVDGVVLTNWSSPFTGVEDASGNWNWNFQSHRSLDPRYVWKLEMNFEPESDFGETNLAVVNLPAKGPFTKNVDIMGVPVTVSLKNGWIDASMPTNRTDLALKFVCVADADGKQGWDSSGSWNQHYFHKGYFMERLPNGHVSQDFTPASLTLAVVPNVHTTFYVQPKLVSDENPPAQAAR
jgi:hypothetical protein